MIGCKITLNPDSRPLQTGTSISVCIEGGVPNSTITVTISNMMDPGEVTETVTITTDANGEGCASWTVWSELYAQFQADGCTSISRQVTAPLG